MAAKLKNIEKVAKAVGGEIGKFSDNSLSWVVVENKDYSLNICFDGKGEKFQHITVAKKIYQQVDEEVICRIRNN